MPELNAITFAVTDMGRSLAFYEALGFQRAYGGPNADFTSLHVGANFINLQLVAHEPGNRWGRVVIHVDSPDELHQLALSAGYEPGTAPADAPWGERYFHILDPDGHELSFARLLES